MDKTPGVIIPTFYSSQEELEADLRRRDNEAGHTPFNPEDFMHSSTDVLIFLEHYGKKGMKWGTRKGKSQVKSTERTSFKKAPKRLTSHELETRIKRMEMEKKYNSLNKRDIGKGVELSVQVLQGSGKKIASVVLTGAALYGIKKAIEKKLGSEAASMITKRGK